MKKILLGSTALATAGLIAVNAPMAADPMQITITGYFQSYMVFGDWDTLPRNPANTVTVATGLDGTLQMPTLTASKYKFKQRTDLFKLENEIHFNGRSKLDNGMVLGFRVELEGYTSGDQVDEYYIFAAGDWGRIEYGATDQVDRKMVYSAPSALPGHGFGTHNIFSGLPQGSQNDAGRVGGGPAMTATTSGNSGDANGISYFTPRFAGFQLGITYTSEFQPGLNGNVCAASGGYSISYGTCTKNDGDQWQHQITLAANFLQKFNNVDIALYAGWFHADVEVKGAYRGGGVSNTTGLPNAGGGSVTNAGVVTRGLDLKNANWTAWSVGAQFGFQGFTLGGGMGRDNNGLKGNNETWFYAASIRYVTGPWSFSAGAYRANRKESREFRTAVSPDGITTAVVTDVGQNGRDRQDLYEIAASYALGPGITLSTGVMWNKYDGQTKTERADSWQWVFGTTFAF